MPPLPPIVDEADAQAFVEWLKHLAAGHYHLDVASDFTPQIAPELATVFQIGDTVFTIWPQVQPPLSLDTIRKEAEKSKGAVGRKSRWA